MSVLFILRRIRYTTSYRLFKLLTYSIIAMLDIIPSTLQDSEAYNKVIDAS